MFAEGVGGAKPSRHLIGWRGGGGLRAADDATQYFCISILYNIPPSCDLPVYEELVNSMITNQIRMAVTGAIKETGRTVKHKQISLEID